MSEQKDKKENVEFVLVFGLFDKVNLDLFLDFVQRIEKSVLFYGFTKCVQQTTLSDNQLVRMFVK